MASTVAHEQLGMKVEQQISEIDSESSSGCDDREIRKRILEDMDTNSGGSPKKRRKQTTPVRFPTSLMSNSDEHLEFAEAEEEDEEEEEQEEDVGENDDEDDDVDADENDFDGAEVTMENGGTTNRGIDEEAQSLLEGKPRTISPQAFMRNIIEQTTTATTTTTTTTTNMTTTTTKDENLNSGFRCQFCALSFNGKNTLVRHLECEHAIVCNALRAVPSNSPMSDSLRVKIEPSINQIHEDPESPVNLSGLGIKSFAANWLNSQAQAQQQQQHLQSQSQNPEDWTLAGSVNNVQNHLQALTFPGALAQYLPLPPFSLTDAGQLPRPPVGPAPIRIFNPDAYCDLCNKEFCNKYFLKTHKANKHGIYVDAPCQNPGDNSMPGGLFTGAFTSGANVKIENAQRLEVPAPFVTVPLTNSVPCDICQKRFKNEESLRKHKQKVHNESMDHQESHSLPATGSSIDEERDVSGNSPSAMEALFKQEFGIEQEDTKFMPAPRHLSPQSSQQARDSGFNADRLRRLGVINPEAFCEICCKEYCNKYFLRTHKMKRHGILVQEGDKTPSNPGSAASWHQIQTSPLNLIVTDSNPASSSESGERNDDFECKPCGMRFQTLGLYRSHCARMHQNDEQKSPKQDYEIDLADHQRTDSISEDLQKLQTMILQLNGLESGKTCTCAVCGKDCENIGALRIHMSLEHAGMTEELTLASQSNEIRLNGNSSFCTLCEKEFPTADALRQHITEDHRRSPNNVPTTIAPQVPMPSIAVPIQASVTAVTTAVNVPVPTNSTVHAPATPQTERKITSMTPTSSYCELCRKELCNKYFMKTHMQKMHNIEIENGSQIGGVICNICNKELCSKYFLRVHKQNTHGIVDEGSTASNKQEAFDLTNNDDTALKPDQLGDLSHRYFTHFTEVCPVCSRRFRSIKWLKAHLLGDHGKAGIDKWRELENQYQNSTRGGIKTPISTLRPGQQNQGLKIPNGLDVVQQQLKNNDYAALGNQVLSSLFGSAGEEQQAKSYRCSYCNFTTTVLPFLFLHERSHSSPQQDNNATIDGGTLQCPICSQAFVQPELLHHHLLTHHQFTGLLSQFPGPAINSARNETGNAERNSEIYEKGTSADYEGKDDRHSRSPQVSAINAESNKSQKSEEPAVQVTPQGAYKCAQCGYATANLNRIKKHIRKDHKAIGDATESVIDELSKTLRDVANKHKVPASYAMPQDMNSNPDATTVMQPFFIEERDIARIGDDTSVERRFAPALVYLPVRARINSVLTTSFTLSPA